MKIRWICASLSSLIISACATGYVDPRPPEEVAAERDKALGDLYGTYKVYDSRSNYRDIDTVHFELLDGQPVLSLYKKDGTVLVESTQKMGKCLGFVGSEKNPIFRSVMCDFRNSEYADTYFSLDVVTHEEVIRSPAMIPTWQPMTLKDGYLLRFRGSQRGQVILALRKS
jgi:hypothetical protein